MIGKIIKGWVLWLFTTPAPWVGKRRGICFVCSSNKRGICSQCGCIIKAKTALPEAECPLNKWHKYEQGNI